MGQRRDRLNKRQANAIKTRRKKSMVKTAERGRRESAILAILKEGELPYTPGVMSWLSERLDKKASRITKADVKTLLS